jgi:hypothetical protein
MDVIDRYILAHALAGSPTPRSPKSRLNRHAEWKRRVIKRLQRQIDSCDWPEYKRGIEFALKVLRSTRL